MINLLHILCAIALVAAHAAIVDPSITVKAEDSVPGLEYLGSGYDAAIRKKESALTGLNDAYKNPILSFDIPFDKKHTNNTLEYIVPTGVYINNFPSCAYKKENKYTRDKNEYSKSQTANIDVESKGIKDKVESSYGRNKARNSSKRFHIQRCSVYAATTRLSGKSEFTRGFTASFQHISEYAKLQKSRLGCDAAHLNEAKCLRVLSAWFQFFHAYGTHIVTRVVLGGTRAQVNDAASSSRSEHSKYDGGNGFLAGKLELEKDDEHKNINLIGGVDFHRKYTIMGGDVAADFGTSDFSQEWVTSLHKMTVPVKVGLVSIGLLFQPEGLEGEYAKAIALYREKQGFLEPMSVEYEEEEGDDVKVNEKDKDDTEDDEDGKGGEENEEEDVKEKQEDYKEDDEEGNEEKEGKDEKDSDKEANDTEDEEEKEDEDDKEEEEEAKQPNVRRKIQTRLRREKRQDEGEKGDDDEKDIDKEDDEEKEDEDDKEEEEEAKQPNVRRKIQTRLRREKRQDEGEKGDDDEKDSDKEDDDTEDSEEKQEDDEDGEKGDEEEENVKTKKRRIRPLRSSL